MPTETIPAQSPAIGVVSETPAWPVGASSPQGEPLRDPVRRCPFCPGGRMHRFGMRRRCTSCGKWADTGEKSQQRKEFESMPPMPQSWAARAEAARAAGQTPEILPSALESLQAAERKYTSATALVEKDAAVGVGTIRDGPAWPVPRTRTETQPDRPLAIGVDTRTSRGPLPSAEAALEAAEAKAAIAAAAEETRITAEPKPDTSPAGQAEPARAPAHTKDRKGGR